MKKEVIEKRFKKNGYDVSYCVRSWSDKCSFIVKRNGFIKSSYNSANAAYQFYFG